jgi:tetratricopeptide (TPR) repeat protein
MIGRALLGLAVLLAGGAGLRAAQDDLGKPYSLRIIVQVGAHRLLTRDFRDKLQSELRNEFQAALGRAGKVEVRVLDLGAAPPDDLGPLVKLVADKDLGALEAASELTGRKTHFLQLDYADGQYLLAARQHDGYTGLASPLVRTARTPDRQSVGRTAVRLMGLDFGAVGVVREASGETARVELKAAKLDPAIGRLVRKGDVFALARTGGGSGAAAGRIPDTLLVVEDEVSDGTCPCRVLTNRKQLPPLQGLSVLELGTLTAPLRLRLNDENGSPVINATVSAGPSDAAAQPLRVEGNLYVSSGPVANYSWVRIQRGAVIVARYPIELLQDGVVVRSVENLGAGEKLSELVDNWRELVAQAGELSIVHASNFRQVAALVAAGKNREALEKAQASLEFLRSRRQEIHEQRVRLTEETRQANREPFPEDAYCQRLLKDLAEGEKTVLELIDDLKEAQGQREGQQDKAKQVRALVARANIQRNQAEYEEAIKLYQQALQLDPGQTKVSDELKRLQTEWGKRDPQAASFAYKIWPNQTTAQDIRTQLDKARQMFGRSRGKGDKLVPQKLLQVARTTLISNLKQQAEPLLRSPSADDQKTLVLIRNVLQDLRKFEEEVAGYLGGDAGGQ